MTDAHARTAAVVRHPAVADLGRDAGEQRRVEAFARDLAAWLDGAPREQLAPLARVVTAVGGRALRDARVVCEGLPLLAIEAAARATAALWPLLRDTWIPPEDEAGPAPSDGDGDGDGAASGAGGTGGGDGDEAGAPSDGSGGPGEDDDAREQDVDREDDGGEDDPRDPMADALEVLAALADQDAVDDPDLEQLARRLAASDDVGAELTDTLEPIGEQAFGGARDGEELARTLEQLVPGVGWGASPGALHATLARRLDQLVHLLQRLPALRDLVERLGRAEAADAHETVPDGGSEEVTGVHHGGDPAHALPAELALLSEPDTEDLFYQRLIERRLVSLELAGSGLDGVTAPEVRGPVLACVDTSGSMAGAPEAVAKAVVLAVCRRVLPQGRAVHLLLFGAAGEHSELRLRQGRGGLEALLDFLAMGFDGGTDFDTPLLRALELLELRDLERADVLVVTDGYARAGAEVVQRVEQARVRRGLRVMSVVVGRGIGGVAPFSDEVWTVDPAGDGSAVGLVQRLAGGRPVGPAAT